MVMIYDITKTLAINSHQILSVFFEKTTNNFTIKVMIAAGSGDGGYGGYGAPITYTVYNEENPCNRTNEQLAKIRHQLFRCKGNQRFHVSSANLKKQIADLEKEESDLLKNPEYEINLKKFDETPQQKFKKLVQLLSDPEFINSKTPAELENIL